MKICIATLYNEGYKSLGNLTVPIMQKYASHHGYDLVVSNNKWIPDERPFAWNKLGFLNYLTHGYDWVLWVDVDTLFVDFSYKIEDFIDENFYCVLGFSHQEETGVFLLKNAIESRELMTKAYAKTEFINDGAWEQTAIKHVLYENQKLNLGVKRIGMDPWNVDPNHVNPPGIHPLSRAPGMVKYHESKKPFIIHAGWGQENEGRKHKILSEYIDKIKYQ